MKIKNNVMKFELVQGNLSNLINSGTHIERVKCQGLRIVEFLKNWREILNKQKTFSLNVFSLVD